MYLIIIILGLILYLCKNINKSKLNREKILHFECGLEPFDEARNKYFIKFYLIAIIFLIFDIEIILLYPITIYYSLYVNSIGFFTIIFFLIILSIGLAYEINKKILLNK